MFWALGSHLHAFRVGGTGGEGAPEERPRCGPGSAVPRRALGGGCWHAVALPPLPLCLGHPPQVVRSEPLARGPATSREPPCEYGGGGGPRSKPGAAGRRGPSRLLPRPPVPLTASGPLCPGLPAPGAPRRPLAPCSPAGRRALGAPLPGFSGPRPPSPGRERAVAACGCCSNEKSEQLNRKIWIKKLEFNTHAPHLLKH